MWSNFKDRGATYLVLARVAEAASALDDYRKAVPGAAITTVRVITKPNLIAQRLGHREAGSILDALLKRSRELDAILDAAAVEDFSVDNSGRPLREVASDILRRLDWPHPTSG